MERGDACEECGLRIAGGGGACQALFVADNHFVVACTHMSGHGVPPIPAPPNGGTRFHMLWEFMLDRCIMTSAMNFGMAGGPLCNTKGQIIGVTFLNLNEIGRALLAVPCVLTRDPGQLKSAAMKCLALTGACMATAFIAYQMAGHPPVERVLQAVGRHRDGRGRLGLSPREGQRSGDDPEVGHGRPLLRDRGRDGPGRDHPFSLNRAWDGLRRGRRGRDRRLVPHHGRHPAPDRRLVPLSRSRRASGPRSSRS